EPRALPPEAAAPIPPVAVVPVDESGHVACPLGGTKSLVECLACPRLSGTVAGPSPAIACRIPTGLSPAPAPPATPWAAAAGRPGASPRGRRLDRRAGPRDPAPPPGEGRRGCRSGARTAPPLRRRAGRRAPRDGDRRAPAVRPCPSARRASP